MSVLSDHVWCNWNGVDSFKAWECDVAFVQVYAYYVYYEIEWWSQLKNKFDKGL